MSEPIDVPCQKCGTTITIIPIGGVTTGICDACINATSKHKDEAHAIGDRRVKWHKLTQNFAHYRNTDFYRLPYPEKTQIALRWQYSERGLNLWGPPKAGKTRTMVMVCQQLFEAGKRMKLFGPSDFAIKFKEKGWDYDVWLNQLRCYDVLAFDDIGKARLTPMVEGHWFGLLEYFIGVGKPVILTHNFTAEEVAKRFKHGEAIVARLRENYQNIYFGEKP